MGLFSEGPEKQKDSSGLFYIDLTQDTPKVVWSISGRELLGQIIGFGIASIDSENAIFVSIGNPQDTNKSDRLFRINRNKTKPTYFSLEAETYSLGPPCFGTDNTLLVPVGSNTAPHIQRFKLNQEGEVIEQAQVNSNPSVGLPPRLVQRFRKQKK